jgi:AhpD family alkylhydroperoxidase
MARIARALEPRRSEDQGDRISGSVAAIMAHRPEIAEAIGGVMAALRTTGTLSPRVIELIRLRIAYHNQCRSCMAVRYRSGVNDGVTEDLVCSLEQPEESDDLTAAERAALHYADLFATNHLAIGDEAYDALRVYFTEAEIVEIGFNCAIDVGFGRLVATWKVTEELPERFQVDGTAPIVPWERDGVPATG